MERRGIHAAEWPSHQRGQLATGLQSRHCVEWHNLESVTASPQPQRPSPDRRRACPGAAHVAVAAAALLALVALPHAQARRPDILLITLDTTRADRMGFLGSVRGLTPSLDALATDSVVFTRAYAQAPITTVSHATILTGLYPPAHGVDELGAPLGRSIPYLPDILERSGYRTGAFVGSLVLDPKNGTAQGFDRGFDQYDAGFRLRRPGEDRYQTIERRGDQVADRALAWQAAGGGVPSFLWVHLFDPHDPYDPPRDLRARFASAPYDGEIAAVDRVAAKLIAAAAANTLIVVAADHGEALGDHGESTHGVFLYEATLHVPLLVRFPDRARAGARVTARVRLADVAPTILDAVGVPVPSEMQGASMRPVAMVGAGVAGGAGPAGRAGGDAAAGQRGRSDRTADGGGGDRPVYSEPV